MDSRRFIVSLDAQVATEARHGRSRNSIVRGRNGCGARGRPDLEFVGFKGEAKRLDGIGNACDGCWDGCGANPDVPIVDVEVQNGSSVKRLSDVLQDTTERRSDTSSKGRRRQRVALVNSAGRNDVV